ncbi:MAG: helix-turn-helix transcriptional regulator [Eubacteriales bacterium]|nr:helix-turn-helix transcriptional regulator [Eubacteriales bacterium]
MMIHAYRELYLNKAQSVLADAFDYAVNVFHITGSEFVSMFIVSSISKRMENGDPSCLAGKSGIEIAMEIIREVTGRELSVKMEYRFGRTVEYWIGWAVAYYQWYSDRSYNDIFKAVSFEELQNMYYPLHEADIMKFVDAMDERIRKYFSETNLKRIRQISGYSQTALSNDSGVSLRSIQMYEQRKKDINKAGADKLYRLSKTLGCDMEALIEKG